MTTFDLKELSDEAFVQRLVLKTTDRSWSIREIAEIERRGFEILDSQPELKREIQAIRDGLVKSATNALQHYKQNYETIAKAFPKPSLPKLPEYILNPRLLSTITGPLPENIGNIEATSPSTSETISTIAIEHLLQEIKKSNNKIAESLNRDLVFWLIFASSAISAVCAVASLLITILEQS